MKLLDLEEDQLQVSGIQMEFIDLKADKVVILVPIEESRGCRVLEREQDHAR